MKQFTKVFPILFTFRYSAPGLPKTINCNHDKKGNTYKCVDVSYADQVNFHQAFYSEPNKQLQDSLILKYTDTVKPSRYRPMNEERGEKTRQ